MVAGPFPEASVTNQAPSQTLLEQMSHIVKLYIFIFINMNIIYRDWDAMRVHFSQRSLGFLCIFRLLLAKDACM